MVTKRTVKADPLLAEALESARLAITEITPAHTVGAHLDYSQEAERVGAHHFANHLPGYRGWVWFATVTRAPRSKVVTVSEVGLLPSEGALLAPEWVPWSARVLPEELPQLDLGDGESQTAGETAEAEPAAAEPEVPELETASSAEPELTPEEEFPVDIADVDPEVSEVALTSVSELDPHAEAFSEDAAACRE